MKIEIVNITARGIQEQELVVLRALQNCNLMFFTIAKTVYTGPNNISSNIKNFYWFAPRDVKAGDYIWLYTGVGINSQHLNTSNTTTYVYYWDLPGTIFRSGDDCAVIFENNDWRTSAKLGI